MKRTPRFELDGLYYFDIISMAKSTFLLPTAPDAEKVCKGPSSCARHHYFLPSFRAYRTCISWWLIIFVSLIRS